MYNNMDMKDARAAAEAGAGSATAAAQTMPELPADALIIIPVRNLVLFPGLVMPLRIGRERTVAAAQEAMRNKRRVGIVLQRNPEADVPTPQELYAVGTTAVILRYLTAPDGSHHLVCQGEQRFRVTEFLSGYPFDVARVELVQEVETHTPEIEARMTQLKERATEVIQLIPEAPAELAAAAQSITSPAALADFVGGLMELKPEEKQNLLETFDLQQRFDKVLHLLAGRIDVLRLSRKIDEQTQERLGKRQREMLLREQLRTIHEELGEAEGTSAEIAELTEAIAKAKMPEEVENHAKKELKRLQQMPEGDGE